MFLINSVFEITAQNSDFPEPYCLAARQRCLKMYFKEPLSFGEHFPHNNTTLIASNKSRLQVKSDKRKMIAVKIDLP